MTSSPHFNDHAPVQTGAPADYPGQITGPGRYCALGFDGLLGGVLWTNETDGLGVLPANDATPDSAAACAALRAAVRAAAARGTDVMDAFEAIRNVALALGLDVTEVAAGDLGEMARAALA